MPASRLAWGVLVALGLALLPACTRSRCCPRPCASGDLEAVVSLDDVTPDTAAGETPSTPDDKPPAWPSEAARTVKEGHAPAPFTAQQIQAACGPGHVRIFRMEAQGTPAMRQIFTFVESDDAGAVLEIRMETLDGATVGTPATSPRQTWAALQAHGSYPKDDVRISEEVVETPAGSYESLRYTVTQKLPSGVTSVRDMWFAKDLPGPPVLMRTSADDEVVHTMVLLEVKNPKSTKDASGDSEPK